MKIRAKPVRQDKKETKDKLTQLKNGRLREAFENSERNEIKREIGGIRTVCNKIFDKEKARNTNYIRNIKKKVEARAKVDTKTRKANKDGRFRNI